MSGTYVDIGPLTWVKGEIEASFSRTAQALAAYAARPEDTAPLGTARSHLHQAHGALAIVGLDGVTRVTEELELLLADLTSGKAGMTPAIGQLATRTLGTLRRYLDDLAQGTPDKSLRLLPLASELAAARSAPEVSPVDLFFPDLALRPPLRAHDPSVSSAAELGQLIRAERARFERGFLGWLKDGKNMAGVVEMRHAVAAIEASQSTPTARAFWWAAIGLFDALGSGGLVQDNAVKRVCASINQQFKRLIEGSRSIPERLMREVLYYVATASSGNAHTDLVRQTYHLDELVPREDAAMPEGEAETPSLEDARQLLLTAEDHWHGYSAGSSDDLALFHATLKALAETLSGRVRSELATLIQRLTEIAAGLADGKIHPSDAFAIETATALLVVENALLDHGQFEQSDLAPRQVQFALRRLDTLARGGTIAGLAAQERDEVSRQAQEKLARSQVVHEMQANLVQVEQTLDAYFRNPAHKDDLATLDTPIRQVRGALTMLGADDAETALDKCAEMVADFRSLDTNPSEQAFGELARRLAELGFYIDQLLHGQRDFASATQPVTARDAVVFETELEPIPYPHTPLAPADQLGEATEPPVEHQPATQEPAADHLAFLRRNLGAMAEVAQAQPPAIAESPMQPPGDAGEDPLAILRLNLGRMTTDGIESDALVTERDITEDTPSVEHFREADVISIDDARVEFIGAGHEAPARTFSSADDEAFDEEMLPIFLGEARDVLTAMPPRMASLAAEPGQITQIRRGFHTLKGSSRMVGLKAFGEAAWTVEQALNRWLQTHHEITPAVERLVGEGHALMQEWVEEIARGSLAVPGTERLRTLADQLNRATLDAEDVDILPAIETAPSTVQLPVDAPADTPPDLVFEAVEDVTPTIDVQADAAVVPSEEASAPIEPAAPAAPLKPAPAPEAAWMPIGDLQISRALYDMFLGESRGHLTTLRQTTDHLSYAQDAVDERAARALHTLAGIAGTVGLQPVRELAAACSHALERTRGTRLDPTSIDLLVRVRDALHQQVDAVAAGQPPRAEPALVEALASVKAPPTFQDIPVPAAPLHAGEDAELDVLEPELAGIFLQEARDLVRQLGDGLRAWKEAPDSAEHAQTIARQLHTLKGSARVAGATGLGARIHDLETSIEAHQTFPVASSATFVESIEARFDRITERIEAMGTPVAAVQAEDVEADIPVLTVAEPVSEVETSQRFLRIRSETVDKLVNQAGEISIARARIEGELRTLKLSLGELTENVSRLRQQLREVEIQAETQMASRIAQAEAQHAEFDPLEMDRYTRLQELTRLMAESVNDVATVQHNLLRNLHQAEAATSCQARINRELSQGLMGMRMLPLADILDRLHRTVRQSAREVGRRANLDVKGADVELDRSVLERMTAPLEHLLRNAVSHGLEDGPDRYLAGKDEAGRITLSATQEGNEILIELSDDGRGLNFNRIRARAVEMNLLRSDEDAGEARLTDFIFLPGFSTAAELSQIAGRGVGMDVVKSEVSALGGRIEVGSQAGAGTRFRIWLPLTLAVTRALMVSAGGKHYAVPSVMVEQVQELRTDQLDVIVGAGRAEWLNFRYPYHYLPGLLGETDAAPALARRHWLVLLRAGDARLALHVDDVAGNQEIVVKNLGPQLARVLGFSGATVLPDGEIVLILNPAALVARNRGEQTPRNVPPPPPVRPADPSRPTVLVVDDSLTVRKITTRLLEREGYRVFTAKDGVDALDRLAETVPDVVLVDIEMPRMDGFELTRQMRANERLAHLPIIMITSRIADKHRAYANEIGVNCYLGKPYQDAELLENLDRLIERKTATLH